MAAGFIFGGEGLPQTPQELARMRQLANALRARKTPQNVGEGLQALGDGVASAIINFRANKMERAGREGADKAFMSALGGGSTTSAPASSGAGGVSYSGNIPASDMETDPVNRRIDQGFAAFGGGSSAASTPASNGDWLKYANQGKIRNQPLSEDLVGALGFLPEMGVTMEVFSGGQPGKGSKGARIGSTRHDHGNAADVFFYKDGRKLDWANKDDLPIFEEIVRRGRAAGLTGFGAGPGYMQPGSMHIGFGQDAAWGAEGRGANAPSWLLNAYNSPMQAPSNQMASLNPSVPQAVNTGGPEADARSRIRVAMANRQEAPIPPEGGPVPNPMRGGMTAPPSVPPATAMSVPQQATTPQQPMQGTQRVAQAVQGLDQQTLQIIDAMNNPFLSEGQRAVLSAVLQQRQQASDPMRQMQLEKGRIELEQMRNPQQSLINAGGGRLYDPNSQKWITAPESDENGFRRATPEEASQYGAAGGQFGPDGRFYPINPPSGTALNVDPNTGAISFQQGAGVKPMTEGQSKDTVFATRAEGALPTLDKYEKSLTSVRDTIAGSVPIIGNMMKSDEYQQAEQAGLEFLQAILRKDTGAAITEAEQNEYGKVYLPLPGDTEKTIKQKRQSRVRALEAIKAGMPPHAILAQEKALRNTDAGTTEPEPNAFQRNKAPQGVDQSIWDVMTPEEKALWK